MKLESSIFGNIHFMAAQMFENKLIASCYEFNGLFEMDINSGDVNFIMNFPGEKIFQKALYRDSILVNDSILFIPDKAKNIAIYNLKSKMINMVNLPVDKEQECSYNGKLYNDRIYLIPSNLKYDTLVFNVENMKFAEESLDIKKNIIDSGDDNFAYKIEAVQGNLYIPIIGKTKCVCINLDTHYIFYLDTQYNINNILSDGKICYLFLENNSVISINGLDMEERASLDINYQPICFNEDKAVVFDKNDVVVKSVSDCFNKLTDINIINQEEIIWNDSDRPWFFRAIHNNKTKIIISINTNGFFIIYDGIISFVKMKKFFGIEKVEKIFEYTLKEEHSFLIEGDNIALSDYIELV